MQTTQFAKNIFISYSHKDADKLSRLHVFLKPLEREGVIDRWDDTRIKTGQNWKDEIEKALRQAGVAVLLVSQDFLASDFIANNELPLLFEAAKERGTIIMPVILSPCHFLRTKSLSSFQAVNDPEEPLSSLSAHEQDKVWLKLTADIEDAISNP